MLWDASPNAGFTTNVSGAWLPISHDFRHINVANQINLPNSHLNVLKRLLQLRLAPTLQVTLTPTLTPATAAYFSWEAT